MWAKKAKATHNIELIWDRDVELFLMGGYNIRFGVRSIKNEVERRVIKQLASAHDLGIIRNGSIVRLTVHWPTSELGSAYIKLLTKVNKNEEFVEIDEEMF
ncbi:hypothetical protein L9F63_027963 [Diploptera punctata]|uniref:Uncharacterized protein n=1 Tax=Diploptera punctata TaxID=6984 RepID=A0AAD7ZZR6_DIPPU|nr:hypothetical protein L9F63_027963 [Diploptera punctata]